MSKKTPKKIETVENENKEVKAESIKTFTQTYTFPGGIKIKASSLAEATEKYKAMEK